MVMNSLYKMNNRPIGRTKPSTLVRLREPLRARLGCRQVALDRGDGGGDLLRARRELGAGALHVAVELQAAHDGERDARCDRDEEKGQREPETDHEPMLTAARCGATMSAATRGGAAR